MKRAERSERASNILRLYLPTVYFYGGGWRLFLYSSISLCSRDFNSFMALVFEYISLKTSNMKRASGASERLTSSVYIYLRSISTAEVGVYFFTLLFHYVREILIVCSRDFNSFMALVFEYISRNIDSGAERASNILRLFLPTVHSYGDFIFIYHPFHFRCSRDFMVLWY